MRSDRLGFTLIELMIVISLLGIVLAIAIPAFMEIVDGLNLRAAARGGGVRYLSDPGARRF